MGTIHQTKQVLTFVSFVLLSVYSFSQATIYRSDGSVIKANITEIDGAFVKFTRSEVSPSPQYTMKLKVIDSIVYANGVVDNMHLLAPRRVRNVNIPQLNTLNLNLLGFAHLSFNPAFERRLKNGKIGLRFPLYIGFTENKIAGMGTFTPYNGIEYEYDTLVVKKSCNVSVGFNPKFYLNKHRIVRLFAGPEVNIGFTSYGYRLRPNLYNTGSVQVNLHNKKYFHGTFSTLGIVGINIYPKDRFDIVVHGGAGVGSLFNSMQTEWVGTWQLGVSLGNNF